MSALIDDKRRLVPRWRPFGAAVKSGELGSQTTRRENSASLRRLIEYRKDEWLKKHTPESAVEFLNIAIVSRQPGIAKVVATEILKSDLYSYSKSIEDAAKYVLGIEVSADSTSDILDAARERNKIAEFKRILRRDPRDSIVLAELALFYARLGQLKKAERSIHSAYILAPENRYVLRSFVRFLIHTQDVERAYAVLKKSAKRTSDPWIAAAEVSTLSILGKSPKGHRQLKKLIEGDYSPRDTSELAAALAICELNNGAIKPAKKLMKASLRDPTDNVLAQVQFLDQQGFRFHYSEESLTEALAVEARSIRSKIDSEWKSAMGFAWGWAEDEAFSNRPFSFGSYLAIVATQEFREGERFARQGIRSNPDDFELHNNLAVALASQGKIKEAEKTVALQKRRTNVNIPVLTATNGLIAFRNGKIRKGRELYASSVKSSLNTGQRNIAGAAVLHWAQEEGNAKTSGCHEFIEAALSKTKFMIASEYQAMRERLKKYGGKSPVPNETNQAKLSTLEETGI